MIIRLLFIFALILFGPATTRAQDATAAHKDSLNGIVDRYYDLNLKVFQADSSVEDIDRIFDLFTDDFEYVHPKYGGTYSRQDLYEGYVNNRENGAYNGSITEIRVVNRITGLNAVAVEKRFITQSKGVSEEGLAEMTLFEIRNGKIARIREYW